MPNKFHALPFAALLALAGCAAPEAKPAVTAVPADGLGLGNSDAPVVDQNWWHALGDAQLDRIMADALAGNPGLDSALARLREAQAVLAARKAENLPQIAFDGSEQRTRLSERYTIPPPYGGSTQWVGQAQANLSWNLDFWGRQADAIAGQRASARAATLDHRAARLSLTGAVAQTYVELARAERQIAIARANAAQRQHSLQLTRTRIRSQLASSLDARAVETLVAQAEQALVRAEGQRVMLIHALASLAGKGADYYPTIAPTKMNLGAVLPLPAALPADLLARRPDIGAARARIDAAAAGKSVARKAFYPNINLAALIGTQALGLGNLFTADAGTYGAGAAIHLPIFEGGKLRADHEAATARLDGAIASYNATVIGAVRDVADALAGLDTARNDLAEQRQLSASLTEVSRLNGVRVSSGLDSRLELIGSEIRLLEAQQDEANLESQAALSAIKLLVAVGGGFAPEPGQLAINAISPGNDQ